MCIRDSYCGATLVLLLVEDQEYAFVWVGDSFGGVVDNNRVSSSLSPHVVGGSGADAHLLTRAIGTDDCRVDSVVSHFDQGLSWLLLSDGVDIPELLNAGDDDVVRELIDQANSDDNKTAVYVHRA